MLVYTSLVCNDIMHMGRVFSYEQTQEASKYVPSSGDFEAAIENFAVAAGSEIARGTISGAVIYGSVAIRAYTLRSDFDCLVVPYDHSIKGIRAISRVISAIGSSGRIDVGAIVHPRDRLAGGMHEIDRFFGDHLTGQSRLVYGEDVKDYIKFSDYGAYTHLISYIRHKKRSVATSFTTDGPEYYKGLQRILELPLAVGRKTLRAVDELERTTLATSDSADKSKIAPASLKLFDDAGLGEVPRVIMQLDKSYTDMLMASLSGEVREQEYKVFLDKIAEGGITASRWLDNLDEYLSGRYGQQQA